MFLAPGTSLMFNRNVTDMLLFGEMLRSQHLWKYPLLPEAVVLYQEMASGREFRISGPEGQAERAMEWITEAKSYLYDGTIAYGFEQFIKRRAMDYLCIGRTSFVWGKNGDPLRYTDPVYMRFDIEDREWIDRVGTRYPEDFVVIDHPIPIGDDGSFRSPIFSLIPTAQLAWLIREHDMASADGRKIRDIILVGDSAMKKAMTDGIDQILKLWSGENVNAASSKIPIITAELSGDRKLEDMVFRVGLANIPEGFDRAAFMFEYVNGIAAALGLSLRHIWNSEKATNRALEEVQEARQAQKGPSSFVRTEQRLINASGCLHQFSRKCRFGFIEEVDTQSQEVRAKVLKLYAESLIMFAQAFGGNVNGDAFLAWLQTEEMLPADLDLVTDMGTVVASDEMGTPTSGNSLAESQKKPSPILRRSIVSEESLGENEIIIDSNFRVIARRKNVFTIEKMIENRLKSDPVEIEKLNGSNSKPNFLEALKQARNKNANDFFDKYNVDYKPEEDDPNGDIIKSIVNTGLENLTDDDHRNIGRIMKEIA